MKWREKWYRENSVMVYWFSARKTDDDPKNFYTINTLVRERQFFKTLFVDFITRLAGVSERSLPL